MSWRAAVTVWFGITAAGSLAVAQDAPPAPGADNPPPPAPRDEAPQTVPNDVGFGEVPIAESWRFPDPEKLRARVDRRDEIDAAPDRVIVWPTAHTPRKGRLLISNHMGAMTQFSYSPSDVTQLTATVVVPVDVADTHLALSSKFSLSESDNHIFSIQPFAQHRRSQSKLGGNDTGLGLAALLDIVSTNNLVFTFGAVGYFSILAATRDVSYDDCGSRSEFIEGDCTSSELNLRAFPKGGHAIGVQGGLTWYFHDNWSIRGELMTGISAGSVFGSEWLTRDFDAEDEADRFNTGRIGFGLPYDTDLTLGLGVQYSNGWLSVQFSGYALTAPTPDNPEVRDVFLVPMANIGAALF